MGQQQQRLYICAAPRVVMFQYVDKKSTLLCYMCVLTLAHYYIISSSSTAALG
jgi:hypothetical protein